MKHSRTSTHRHSLIDLNALIWEYKISILKSQIIKTNLLLKLVLLPSWNWKTLARERRGHYCYCRVLNPQSHASEVIVLPFITTLTLFFFVAFYEGIAPICIVSISVWRGLHVIISADEPVIFFPSFLPTLPLVFCFQAGRRKREREKRKSLPSH